MGGKEPLRSRLQELDENIDIKKHLKKRKGRAVSEPLWRRENVGPSPSSSRPETRVTNIGFSSLSKSVSGHLSVSSQKCRQIYLVIFGCDHPTHFHASALRSQCTQISKVHPITYKIVSDL